jgi:hypothetical protein
MTGFLIVVAAVTPTKLFPAPHGNAMIPPLSDHNTMHSFSHSSGKIPERARPLQNILDKHFS